MIVKVYPFCFRSPNHMPVPVQSSLCDLFGNLLHSRCSSDVFILDLVFACLHTYIVAFSSCSPQSVFRFVVAHVSAPYNSAGLITVVC